jgi:capsular polysaccharide transport system permease protein
VPGLARHALPPVPAGPFALICRVIVAIMLRELKTRFGRNKFGYLWALIEPMAYIAIFVGIRTFTRDHIPFGQDFALFIVSGVLTVRTFTAIASRGLGAITANRALLAYPPVKPLDLVVARAILESLTMGVIWMVFLVVLSATSDSKVIFHHALFAQAFAAMLYLSFSVSLLNATLAARYPSWERLWGLTRLPLLILSGVFFVPSLMPPWVQSVLFWNPVLHCVEWIRTGMYQTYAPLLDIGYLLGFSTFTLCLGLILERVNRSVITV